MAPSGIRGLTKKAHDQGENFAHVSRWKITILLRQVLATGQLTRRSIRVSSHRNSLPEAGERFSRKNVPDSSPIRVSYPPAMGGKTAILSPSFGIVSRSA
jgi:hypothetical protein